MSIVYRNADGSVDPRKLAACRREVMSDAKLTADERAKWLLRFEQLEASRQDPHPARFRAERDSSGAVTLDIFGRIGESYWDDDFSNSAKRVARELKGAVGTVKVRINSGGGDAFEGDAIRTLLATASNRVEVEIIALAASAASIIAMAGDEISMAENALLMIHNAVVGTFGGVADHRSAIQLLEAVDLGAAQIYARRTGEGEKKKSVEDMQKLMASETWLTAQEAVDMGLADKVVAGKAMAAAIDVSTVPTRFAGLVARAQENIEMDLKALAKRLGLPETATEAEVNAALDKLTAQPPTQQQGAQQPGQQAQGQSAADAQAQLTAAATAELHTAACTAAVERFITAGKIPPAMRETAIKACGTTATSLKATCELFESYPVVVQNAKLPTAAPKQAGKVTQLDEQQKKLARMAGVTDEQFLAELNNPPRKPVDDES